jgi:hypothetical protein
MVGNRDIRPIYPAMNLTGSGTLVKGSSELLASHSSHHSGLPGAMCLRVVFVLSIDCHFQIP